MSEPMYTTLPPLKPCACGHCGSEHYQVRAHCLTCKCVAYAPVLTADVALDAEEAS